MIICRLICLNGSNNKKTNEQTKEQRFSPKQRNDRKNVVFAERFATVSPYSHREFCKDRRVTRKWVAERNRKKRITTTLIYERCSSRSFRKIDPDFFFRVSLCDFYRFLLFLIRNFSWILWLKFIYEAANSACYRWINHTLWAFASILDRKLSTKICYNVTIFVKVLIDIRFNCWQNHCKKLNGMEKNRAKNKIILMKNDAIH